jgi:hypothetical protein
MALVRRPTAVGRAMVPATPGTVTPPVDASVAEQAAAVPSRPARIWAVLGGLGLIGAGGVGAFNIQQMVTPSIFEMGDQMSTFGALLVFAGAVERILEPFSRFMPGRSEQHQYERAVADMDNGVPGAMNAAAHFKAAMDSARSSRAVLMWGLATCTATLLSASAGFCLMRMLSNNPTSWNGISYWADCLVTGLVVGSGTKPVHDLLTRFQPSSN